MSDQESEYFGRPLSFTDAVGDEICARIASGESLRKICSDTNMPDKATVFRWLLNPKPELDNFRDQYTLARQMQAEGLADEIMEIADDGTNDYVLSNSEEGDLCRVNPEAIGRSRLRVDTRKWYLGKVLPRFKDKQEEKQPADDLAAALMSLIGKQPN